MTALHAYMPKTISSVVSYVHTVCTYVAMYFMHMYIKY